MQYMYIIECNICVCVVESIITNVYTHKKHKYKNRIMLLKI